MTNSTSDESSQRWKEPFAFGVWTLRDPNVEEYEDEEEAKINGKIVHCPFCERPLRMWVEGCSLYHMVCKACDFCLTQITKDEGTYKELMERIY